MERDLNMEQENQRLVRRHQTLLRGWRRVGRLVCRARDIPSLEGRTRMIEIPEEALELLTEAADLSDLLLKRKP